MARTSRVIRQRDFSGGEIVEHAKRRDDVELVRAGSRRLLNRLILPTGATCQRPGRTTLFSDGPRVEEVRMSATKTYRLCFSAGQVVIRNSSGTILHTFTGKPWTNANVEYIRWTRFEYQIYVTFPAMKPRVLTWDGADSWSDAAFAFAADPRNANATLEPFHRYAARGVTMYPSARTGSITLQTSAAVFNASHVGAKFRWCGKQTVITAVTDADTATATVIEELPPVYSYEISATGSFPNGFYIGDVVEVETGDVPPTPVGKGLIIGSNGTTKLYILHTQNYDIFLATLKIIGPTGRGTISNPGTLTASEWATTIWDESICSDYRGWPQSVSADQNRLIFSDLPGVPEAIMWSAIRDPANHLPSAAPDGAIVEYAPEKSRVYSVVGALGDEFVLTDKGVRQIPISTGNPLKPGSVAFNFVTDEPSAQVEPRVTSEGVLYVNAGRNRVNIIVGTGQSARPYVIKQVSDFHAHLFRGIKAIAVSTGGEDIADRYVYAMNNDGTLAVGKVNPGKDWIGWVPWELAGDGVGLASWVSAMGDVVLVTAAYRFDNVTDRYLVEQQDATAWLDGCVPLHSVPTALAAGGSGTLWFYAGATVSIMDADRYLGERAVKVNGELFLQEGDDFDATTIKVGFPWTERIEPFLPHMNEGQSGQQALRPRQIKQAAAAVQDSTGFEVNAIVVPKKDAWLIERRQIKVEPAYLQGEDQALAPPRREKVVTFSVPGSDEDPRYEIVKTRPGPLRVLELTTEIED